MKQLYICGLENNEWKFANIFDYLDDVQIGNYSWKKENREYYNCYVCYYNDKEIGLIPIQYLENDFEWVNWWRDAYSRHPKGLTINVLAHEIMDKHKSSLSMANFLTVLKKLSPQEPESKLCVDQNYDRISKESN